MEHKHLIAVKCYIKNFLFIYSEEIGLMFVFSSNLLKKEEKKSMKRGPIRQNRLHLSCEC